MISILIATKVDSFTSMMSIMLLKDVDKCYDLIERITWGREISKSVMVMCWTDGYSCVEHDDLSWMLDSFFG